MRSRSSWPPPAPPAPPAPLARGVSASAHWESGDPLLAGPEHNLCCDLVLPTNRPGKGAHAHCRRESRGLSPLSCSAGPRCGRCLPTPPGLPNKCHSAESPGGGRDEHVTQQRAFPGLIQICRRGNGLDGFGRAPAAFPQDRLQVMQRTLRPAPSPVSPRADWRGEFTVVGPFSPRRFQSSKQTVHIPLEHVVRPPAPAWTHTHTSTRLFARACVRDLSECEHAPLQAGTRVSTASMHTHTRGQTTPPPGAGSQGRQVGRGPCYGERVAVHTLQTKHAPHIRSQGPEVKLRDTARSSVKTSISVLVRAE